MRGREPLDDLEITVGCPWGARGQVRGVFIAHRVKGAEAELGAVRFNFQVVGDGVAALPVAKDNFLFGVFKKEVGDWPY